MLSQQVVCTAIKHHAELAAAVAQVTIDNCTASNYSVVNVVCRDRKGLVYDLMRTLKDIHVRVAYAKIVVRGDLAETDLFVEEADGQRAKERCLPSHTPSHLPDLCVLALPGAHFEYHCCERHHSWDYLCATESVDLRCWPQNGRAPSWRPPSHA